eukprot:TRINITY_DN5589_c1_g2_i2.p1 TRINITY_DN5589_c1_g2~~TRINITY_DN5589_c1_g2_i2.p1  ORF type:complete len:465 (-),score=125.81 TRINITY_DN5589_c1_g2_i2:1122-2516(-)
MAQRVRLLARAARKCGQGAASESVSRGGMMTAGMEGPSSFGATRGFVAPARAAAGAVALETDAASEGILFPREGPGVRYALNWALAAAGVTPSSEAYRNLKPTVLKEEFGAKLPATSSSSPVYIKGKGPLSKGQFTRLFKEVTAHLSQAPTVFTHDGAVGSASNLDARTRSISDTAAGALALGQILTATSTREVVSHAFPVTVYVASTFSPSILDKGGFVAVDLESSAVVVTGNAVGDAAAIKAALAAAAAPVIEAAGALPLPARFLKTMEGTALLLLPEQVEKQAGSQLQKSDAMADGGAGVVWGHKGVAHLFQSGAANLAKAPSSLLLVTVDESGAVPPISKISAAQAAYYFLAGYDGKDFKWGYGAAEAGLDPLAQAKKLADLLSSASVPTFLVNASSGDSLISGDELLGLVEASVSGKLPKGKGGKKAGGVEEATAALRSKFEAAVAAKYPDGLPSEISA